MSILVWAAIMIVFVVAVVFVKKLPVQYALMVGPFIIALLMGYSVPETVDFFLAQFNGTMKSAGLMIVFSILYFGLLTETGFFSTVGNAVFRLTKGKMNIYVVMAMTVILTAIGMLTATIGTAYLVVFPLMLPFYERMKFDKKAALVIVTCTAAACLGASVWPSTHPLLTLMLWNCAARLSPLLSSLFPLLFLRSSISVSVTRSRAVL